MKKLGLVALVAMLLVGAMVLVSCGSKCPGDGDCSIKADGTGYKWCGTSVGTDKKKAETAAECGAVKNLLTGKAAECDC